MRACSISTPLCAVSVRPNAMTASYPTSAISSMTIAIALAAFVPLSEVPLPRQVQAPLIEGVNKELAHVTTAAFQDTDVGHEIVPQQAAWLIHVYGRVGSSAPTNPHTTMVARRLRRSRTKRNANGMHKRVARLEAVVSKLIRARVDVRRDEHDEVLAALRQLEQHTHDLATQFKRIAQLQADVDSTKRGAG